MVPAPGGDSPGQQAGQAQVPILPRRDPEAVPGGHAIGADFSLRHEAFAGLEGLFDSRVEALRPQVGQLLLGVVEVEQVHRFEAQGLPTDLQLVGQVPGRHGVAAVHQVIGGKDAGRLEYAMEPGAGALLRVGGLGHGDVASLGGDEEPIPGEVLECRAQGPLRASAAVVRSRIEDVASGGEEGARSLRVSCVGGLRGRAEVGAETEATEFHGASG